MKTLLFLVFTFIIFFPAAEKAQKTNNEITRQLIREGDEDLKKQRDAWIEDMHSTEPGVDWRIIDRETRQLKSMEKEALRKKLLKNGKLLSDNLLYAGGRLEGRWIEKGSNNLAGRIRTMDYLDDEQLIYALSSGGNVWRGDINGNNWICLNDYKRFTGSYIKVFRNDTLRRIFVVSNKTAYYSDDEGITWQKSEGLENIESWGGTRRGIAANDQKQTLYITAKEWDYGDNWGSYRSLYRSTDMGKSFHQIRRFETNINKIDIWAPQYDDERAFLINPDTVFVLYPDGNQVDTNIISSGIDKESLNSSNSVMLKGSVYEGKVFLSLMINSQTSPKSKFYVSEDMGKTWDARSGLDFGPFQINSFAVSTLDPDVMFYGGVELFRTFDGGNNWEKVNKWGDYYGDPEHLLHADIPGVNCFRSKNVENDEIVFISTDGGLYESSEYTLSVKNISLHNLNVSQYYSVLTSNHDPDLIFAGAQDQGFQKAAVDTGGSLGFRQVISGDYGHIVADQLSGSVLNTVWTNYPGFTLLYKDADIENMKGFTWNFKNNKNKQWIPYMAAVPGNANEVYIAAGTSTNGLHLWKLSFSNAQIIPNEIPFNFHDLAPGTQIASIGISPVNSHYMYALSDQGDFFLSKDRAESWTMPVDTFQAMGGHYFYGSNILPSKKTYGRLFIAGSGYSNHEVYVSNDHGYNFSSADSGLPNTLVYDIAMTDDEAYIFAATEVGPYVYVVETGLWYDLAGPETPDQKYWSVEYIPDIKTARFATYGRGLWDFKIEKFHVVSVEEQNPVSFDLNVYPNPAYENINIVAGFDNPAYGWIKIFDMDGKMINKVFEGNFARGNRAFNIHLNKNLPPGAYLCILSANGRTIYNKILINK